ncbi:DUF4913 domain-containing protein [Nocardia terpenica]|uniref:DUF4913 domain-containing protein n=1 Tax=Nocardia terpenica TaxID=455432 RepID=A0A164JIG2_9NOCA|nr:DUF4913 domain-containing protein [Nocardia terpenica]KZM70433.1 hypothetical protein AWN90_03900 [Nocardia terpenica]NQE91115.1 DUF4913 domain-containing protein [Nocardia terpenica]
MTGPATAGSGGKKQPIPPAYPNFVEFGEKWLFPFVNVRLAEAGREQTDTWCVDWWRHRAVAVRIAHLHRAFEAVRRRSGSAVSTYLLSHIDAHMRWILDAANGPLHRCTRTTHVAVPALSSAPIPPGWFGPAATATPKPGEETPKRRFGHYSQFVTDWLLPVTAVRISGHQREGQYTWCRRWWDHHGVCIRFATVHAVFEAALQADDLTAMSTLFVAHIDPHMRVILDAARGPLHRCTPDRHIPLPGLPTSTVAPNWFGIANVPVDELGFGPDFRALRART